MQNKRLAPLILTLVVIYSAAGAEERPQYQSEDLLQAGPGILVVDSPYAGVGTRTLPIPMVYYRSGPLLWFGPEARWSLYSDEWLEVAALGALRLEGYRSSDSLQLQGMDKRRDTFELGASVLASFDWGRLRSQWTSDVLNEHKGHEFRLTAERRFADVLEKASVTLSVGCNWRSRELNDYYYGVRAAEATAERPAYRAGSDFGLLTSMRIDYSLTRDWNLFSAVSVEWLGSEITASPIVNRHHRMSVLAGALYTF